MKKLLILAMLLTVSITTVSAQTNGERHDGIFLVYLENSEEKDQRCDILNHVPTKKEIDSLFINGRYVQSICNTKFGTIIVHKENTENIRQLFEICKYDLKQNAKAKFKEGYVLDYIDRSNGYVLYRKDNQITEQEYREKTYKLEKQNKMDALNNKGMYVALLGSFYHYEQNLKEIKQQKYKYYSHQGLIDDFPKMKGWHVGSVDISYNKYGDSNSFDVIFNKDTCDANFQRRLCICETKEELVEYLNEDLSQGFYIKKIWSGFENRNYKWEEESVNNYNGNIFDILTELKNSVSTLVNGNSSSNNSGAYSTGNEYSGSTNTGNVKARGKCKRCNGSGKCSPTSGSGRKNACHGSGLCGYCSGTGWIKAGSSEAKCTACNGKGKCKTCGGTGKCSLCKGTGK